MTTFDPELVLRQHLRAQVVPDPITSVADLVEGIFNGTIAAPRLHRNRPGRRGFGVGLSAVVLVGGSIAAVRLAQQDDLTQPSAALACRAELTSDANILVLNATDEPVAACREQWASGQMNRVRDELDPEDSIPPTDISVPVLVACVGASGGVEVYPISAGQGCGDVELAPVDVVALAADPVLALQDRVSNEINRYCLPPKDMPPILSQMLRDLNLSGWTIVMRSHRPDDPCALIAVDAVDRRLYVIHGRIPENTQPFTTTATVTPTATATTAATTSET